MKQDLVKYLLPEIITNILSRLDVRSIARSKCVSKPWLEFLSTDEFVKLHLSRSATALAVVKMDGKPSRFTLFELEAEINVESSHDQHYNHPINFNFVPDMVTIEGSANGMLFLHGRGIRRHAEALYVCNPITREYIDLHCPQEFFEFLLRRGFVYGFGASKISGQHKVVVYFKSRCDCRIYTLGTGSWRHVEAPSGSFSYPTTASSAIVDGNLHWLVYDSNRTALISCFDLVTECFSTFAVDPAKVTLGCLDGLSALGDCLCLYGRTSENEITFWLMKEYGDDKSWTKEYVINIKSWTTEYVINLTPDFVRENYSFVHPITVSKDGDVLMVGCGRVIFYNSKAKSIQEIGVFDAENAFFTSKLFTPSFLSLKSFPMENVLSL